MIEKQVSFGRVGLVDPFLECLGMVRTHQIELSGTCCVDLLGHFHVDTGGVVPLHCFCSAWLVSLHVPFPPDFCASK